MVDVIDKANGYINTIKNSSSVEERKTAIQYFARLFSEVRSTNEILAMAKKTDELIPVFNTILVDEKEDVHLRKTIIGFYREKTMYPETYDVLKEVFKQGIEVDMLSLDAGRNMMDFEDKYDETKEFFIDQLRSDKEYNRLAALKVISEWNKTTRLEWDFVPLFMQLVKEDKSPQVRRNAWIFATRKGEREQAVQYILKDYLLASLYETLSKFQQNIQVPIARIIELTEKLPLQKMKELVENIEEKDIKISKEEYEEAIQELIDGNQIIGEYYDLEQVFVRKKSKDTLIKPVSFSKEFICYYCGNPLDKEAKTCSACKAEVLRCSVCKLPISFGEEVGKCSLCETKAHLVHIQEWVKTQGKCPVCQKKLPIEGIVPISGIEVKK